MSGTRHSVRYGKERVWVEVPERTLACVMQPSVQPGLSDPMEAVQHSLANPIESAPLSELARNRSDAVIVISDITRPVPNSTILPPILRTLETAGVPSEKILILIATGMHRPNEGDELRELVGDEIADHYRVENHFGLDLEGHTDLGVSEDGIPLLVDRRYVEAGLKIVTGLIEPHLIAGYSGGRKGVLPGVCALETMKVMHGYQMIQHPLTCVGRLDDNPFHLAALRLARQVGVDFLLNVTMNERREITGVYAGDLDAAHRLGCTDLDRYMVAEIGEPADIVVTCGGGYPLDQTLYQSFKGTVAAREILRPGGSLVLAAHLGEGVGSASFRDLLSRMTSPEDMLADIEGPDYLQLDQWMVQDHCNMLLQAGQHYLYSEHLGQEWASKARLELVPSMQEGLDRAMAKQGADARVVVFPEGPYVIAKLSEAVGV